MFGKNILPYYGIKVNITKKKEKGWNMKKLVEKARAQIVLEILPARMAEEISRLAQVRKDGLYGIRELRIRRKGVCTLLLGRESIPLISKINDEEMEAVLYGLTDGALYAHRDTIAEGFISLPRGIRVGVCGVARYDGERLTGISDMSSLIFRIPTGECAFLDRLYSVYDEGIGNGLLIYSPPGVGKTTAIRFLARAIGGGSNPKKVAVIDERSEFDENDYRGCAVDVLKGYKKGKGIEIATRTLSPDLIMIDEIGVDDSDSILLAIKCGVPVIATAHGGDKDEILSRPALKRFFDHRVFSRLLGISIKEGEYLLSVDNV